MYWPLGPPQVYAASKQSRQKAVTKTDDGAPNADLDSAVDESIDDRFADRQQSADSPDTATTTSEEGEDEKSITAKDRLLGQPPENDAPVKLRPAKRLRRRDTYGVDDNGEIIAMRVARAGHMFVTITKTMVMVWQTKVSQNRCWRKFRSPLMSESEANGCISLSPSFSTVSANLWIKLVPVAPS